jgi:hypothetical protein
MARKKKALDLSSLQAYGERLTEVPIPEAGGSVFMKKPTTADALGFSRVKGDEDKLQEKIIGLMATLTCDESGSPLFESVDQVKALPTDIFMRLSDALTRAVSPSSGDTEDEQEEDTPEN